MATLLLNNGSNIDKVIGSLKGLTPTDDQIKKFEALQTAFVSLQQTVYKVGRDIATYLTPYLSDAARLAQEFVTQNEKLSAATAFTWLKTIRRRASSRRRT